jgi:hypothetical protein
MIDRRQWREGDGMFDDDEPPIRLIDPHREVLTGTGYDLDEIGALPDVDLPRAGVEPDADYRARLMVRLRELLVAALTPAVATGEYLDRWMMGHEWRGQMGSEAIARAMARGELFSPEILQTMANSDFGKAIAAHLGLGTAPADESKPNHVRDAVRANQ